MSPEQRASALARKYSTHRLKAALEYERKKRGRAQDDEEKECLLQAIKLRTNQ